MKQKERRLTAIPGVVALFSATPSLVQAEDFGSIEEFAVTIVVFINNTLIPLIFAFALVAFIWGMFRFLILGGGDEESRAKGKSLIFSSITGFVMMVIIFAVVNLLASGILTGMGVPNELILDLPRVSS